MNLGALRKLFVGGARKASPKYLCLSLLHRAELQREFESERE
jgi:hypothetical protein